MTQPLVIYHANCADGFSAAWCFHHFYQRFGAAGGTPEFHPGRYGDAPPDVTGRSVFLVDFSYRRDVVAGMLERADFVTLIDHHRTAIDDLAGLDGLEMVVDLERSGATLAWDYLFPHEPRPLLLGHIEDRDLWRFKLPHTQEISASVFSYPYTFETWDKLMRAEQHELLALTAQGASILRKHMKDVHELVGVCMRHMRIAGTIVPVASLPYTMGSDAAHLMAQGQPFAGYYWDTVDARHFGLRSRPDGADVSEIAKAYGGGGHQHAAGFKVPRTHELAVQ